MFAPSRKNGRFSGKNVSNALRLTTAGSASTCPKSGFTVAVSVNDGVTAYLRSAPIDAPGSGVFCSGLPGCRGSVSTCATVYGTSSSRFDALPILTPLSVPNDDTQPLALFEINGQVDVSFSRATCREIANPS